MKTGGHAPTVIIKSHQRKMTPENNYLEINRKAWNN